VKRLSSGGICDIAPLVSRFSPVAPSFHCASSRNSKPAHRLPGGRERARRRGVIHTLSRRRLYIAFGLFLSVVATRMSWRALH
jgi:hypothetical protein